MTIISKFNFHFKRLRVSSSRFLFLCPRSVTAGGQGKFLQRLPFDDHVLWQMSAVGRRRMASSVCLGEMGREIGRKRVFSRSFGFSRGSPRVRWRQDDEEEEKSPRVREAEDQWESAPKEDGGDRNQELPRGQVPAAWG